MKDISIFISSSMFELEYEREIANQVLKELNMQPVLFEIFPSLSESPQEAYIENVRECDLFILICWKSFSNAVMEEFKEAVKRNKPILIFLKSLEGTEKREPELEKFINDLCSTDREVLSRRTVFKKFRGIQNLQNAIKDSVLNEISKFYKDPVHTLSREEMYELGNSIIRFSQSRLFLYQRTPSLFLGARNYLSDAASQYAYEKEFLDILEKWIKENQTYNDKEMMYLFSATATKSELNEKSLINHKEYVEKVKIKVNYYKNIEEKTGYRFRFNILDIPISGPMIIGDNKYAIWILGDNDAVSISQENQKISSILIRMLKTHCHKLTSANEILKQFGIRNT